MTDQRDEETRTSAGGETSGIPPSDAQGRSPGLPERVGKYRVLRALGEGGMGLVLEAEQPTPRRRVAIKMIRGGVLAGESSRAMFQREVDTLSRLKHPHIASIFEAGTTEDGQPFLAMELVAGMTLDEYVGRHRPPLDREELSFRLRLLQKICVAVHYAHRRGVIHRDLKPANILVSTELVEADGIPVVKILDFGLARLTDVDAPAALATAVGAVKGTLSYMSPEQARGNPGEIDTRTDVYSLGVILYEMLTGSRPHDLDGTSVVEALRVISDRLPRPLRDAWPDGAARLERDLETLAAAALNPDRELRYSGADSLARDLGRYLRREPIEARDPTTTYQLRKFAERNRVLVAGVLATALALAAGIVVSTVLGIREAAQRRQAEAARRDLEEVVEFQSRMLAHVDPERTGLRLLETIRSQLTRDGTVDPRFAPLARELNPADLARSLLDDNILQPAGEAATREFADRPLIQARLHRTLADALTELGLYDKAERALRQASELRSGALGPDDPATLEADKEIISVLFRKRELDEAERGLAQLLDEHGQQLGEDHEIVLSLRYTQAAIHYARGDYDAALQGFEAVLEDQRRVLGAKHADVLKTLSGLGGVRHRRGEFDEAGVAFQDVLDARRRSDGPDAPETLSTMLNLAAVRTKQHRYDEAERLFLDAGSVLSHTLGQEHPLTLRNMNNLAFLYGTMGRLEEAHDLELRTLELRERMLGPTHEETLRSLNNLAYRLVTLERYAEAERVLLDLLARDETAQPGSGDHAVHLHTFGELLLGQQRWDEARPVLRRTLAIYRPQQHANLGAALVLAARTESRLRQGRAALELLREARSAGFDAALELDDPDFEVLRANPEFAPLAAATTAGEELQ